MATVLHVLVPGLLAAPSDRRTTLHPTAPALAWLLARADRQDAPPTADALLFELFGLRVPADADPPAAAITRLADGGEAGSDDWWLRADPIHLRADMHGGVFLADARLLAIEPEEAAALVAAFNRTFAEDGLWLEAPCPERWYLRLPADPGIRTQALSAAIGRDITPLLPDGPNARRWRTLLTEAQMLFHGHPLNQAREQHGRPTINGLWPWGGGLCPTGARAPAAGLYARDPLVRGLARLSGAAIDSLPERAEDWREAAATETDSLVVLEATRHAAADGDPQRWDEQVAMLERDWFAPCRRWLQTGKLTALHLHPGNGHRYTVSRAARWRFWRRARPLIHHMR
ncbi:MAG: hypothetical protein P9E24_06510 [Candidatus Competibacter sp.]|nr:hypothetical protein [Candidatus Competibacter sp.]MDG4585003.1 hypothetical protein [Candidatus Competibacter sp.]